MARLGEGLGVPRLWEVRSGSRRWAGRLQPGFSCGRSRASEADEGPEWPLLSFRPCWRGGQRSTESSRVGDFSGALGSKVTSVRAACLQAGCWTSSSSTSWESPSRPAACAGVPSGGAGRPAAGAGARLGQPGPALCCPDHCCYRLLGLKASSCVLLLGAGFRELPLGISVWSTESVSWLLERIIH